MPKIDGEQRQEFSISTPKFKGSREVNNLECSINYDGKRALVVMYCSLGFVGWFMLGCLGFLMFLGFAGSVFLLSFFLCFGVIFVYFLYA
jgi:hypothetical protein